ncbi:hypothetical protein ACHAXR_005652, partial [Thalassiosira sp. AJA248-18]
SEEQPPADSATIVQGPSLLASTGVHRPSPSLFHLPGLRSLPFWTAPGSSSSQQQQRHRIAFNDPTVTSAVQHVESNYDAIRSEYFSAVLGQGNETNPHNGNVTKPLEPDYDVSSKGGEHAEDALHSGTWDWHSYILNGAKNEKFRERCPKTAQVVDDLEKERMLFGTPFGFCFFSTLHDKSSIKAHSGPMNLRLRMHLPLLVPKKKDSSSSTTTNNTRPTTGIRVADQTREWHEGSSIILDDSYVHEVWNDSEESRVLFLLDLWHPDVRMEEREKITNMFNYARGKGWIGASK